MINHQKNMVMRRVLLLNLAVTLSVLLPGAPAQAPRVPGRNTTTTPAASQVKASIKKIVVGDQSQTEGNDNVTVTRANGEKVDVVSTGLLLYAGDLIKTSRNTKVTVLFLDSPVPENQNEVIIDGDAQVGISSTYSWWGRIWAKVNGLFDSKTNYVQVGAHGTEYELNVDKNTGGSTLLLLEGDYLDVKKVSLAGSAPRSMPNLMKGQDASPQFLFSNFDGKSLAQEQPGHSLDVPFGTVTPFDVTYHLFNECHQAHNFEFHSSDGTDWLQLVVEKKWRMGPAENLKVDARLNIDATQLTPGLHRAHVYFICLDCKLEPLCPGKQLDWPYNINVGPGPRPTPSVTPTPAPTSFRVNELEDVVIPKSAEQPSPKRATDDRVITALNWTGKVILATQPSYSIENIIPHFSTKEQRSEKFLDARQGAILKHEPGSNRILGDIYSDWGQAAWAVKAYNKERVNVTGQQAQSGTIGIDLAEAYRMTGQLDRARDLVLSDADSKSPKAENVLGNIYFDYARIALDKGERQAGDYLEQARTHYASALLSQGKGQGDPTTGYPTIQVNLAKTHIVEGDLMLQAIAPNSSAPQAVIATILAPQANALQVARTKYSAAMQLLADTQQADSTYPFGVTELGRAYQGWGDAAKLEGNAAAANESYARAKSQYNRVITAHRDCAEAYFNLGDLFDDLGDKENAKANYRFAIRYRPEQPASYYPLALLVQEEDPQLAAALASTYLQLEPAVFKQGEKARNAERIARGEFVNPPPRLGMQPVTPSVTQPIIPPVTQPIIPPVMPPVTPPVTPTVTPTLPPVKVPDVKGKKTEEALSRLRGKGLDGQLRDEPDCAASGKVVSTIPKQGESVPRGTMVTVFVSSAGENAVTVPAVTTLQLTEAQQRLASVGLRGKTGRRKEDNSVEQNTVLEQKPTANTKLKPGCTVELTIAIHVRLIPVPKFKGMSKEEAFQQLPKIFGELVRGTVTEVDSDQPAGTVIDQNPQPGEMVRPGTGVDLVIAKPSKPEGQAPAQSQYVEVPKVMDMSYKDAKKTLEGKGLVIEWMFGDTNDPFTVTKQDPTPGTNVLKGAHVKVWFPIP